MRHCRTGQKGCTADGGGRGRILEDGDNMRVVPLSGVKKDDVLLQMRKIPQLDGKLGHKSVLWDTACLSGWSMQRR